MVGTHRIYINRTNNNINNIGRRTMPAKTVILKEGYIEDLMNNYDDSTALYQLAEKSKVSINTLKTMNRGGSISVNSTKKIADYFGIQERYIENSILTEEEAREFLRKKCKKYDIPQIMKQDHMFCSLSSDEMWQQQQDILKKEMGDDEYQNMIDHDEALADAGYQDYQQQDCGRIENVTE